MRTITRDRFRQALRELAAVKDLNGAPAWFALFEDGLPPVPVAGSYTKLRHFGPAATHMYSRVE